MIFIWLAVAIGIAVLAALIESVATEAYEEHEASTRARHRVFRRPEK